MARVKQWLERTRVTEPPPVGPWLGVVGMLVGLSAWGFAAGVSIAVRDIADGTLWPWPAWLVIGTLQFALLLRFSRAFTAWEIGTWQPPRPRLSSAVYVAAGTGFLVASLLDDGHAGSGALTITAGVLLTAAVGALFAKRRRVVPLAIAVYVFCVVAAPLGAHLVAWLLDWDL